jgi:hypothetical protein
MASHEGFEPNLAAVRLMLAAVADRLTAGARRRLQSVKRLPAFALVVCSTGGASVGAGIAATLFLATCLTLFATGLFFLLTVFGRRQRA